MPAPRPRHSCRIVACSPRHARATPAPVSCSTMYARDSRMYARDSRMYARDSLIGVAAAACRACPAADVDDREPSVPAWRRDGRPRVRRTPAEGENGSASCGPKESVGPRTREQGSYGSVHV
eukprot:gene24146-biopygen17890